MLDWRATLSRPYDLTNPEFFLAVETLKASQYLGHLSDDALDHLARCGEYRRFEAKSAVVKRGELMESLLVVLDGSVSVAVEVGSQRPLWLYLARHGSIIDLGVLLETPVAPVSAHALTDVEVFAVPRPCLLQELDRQTPLGLKMTQVLCERLNLIAQATASQAERFCASG